jgi:hypothetical protein
VAIAVDWEPIIDVLNLQVVEFNSRIFTQPPSPPDPRTLSPHPNKFTTLWKLRTPLQFFDFSVGIVKNGINSLFT